MLWGEIATLEHTVKIYMRQLCFENACIILNLVNTKKLLNAMKIEFSSQTASSQTYMETKIHVIVAQVDILLRNARLFL